MNSYNNDTTMRFQTNYFTGQEYPIMGFKRRKRDIETAIEYNGQIYEFSEALKGTYNKALLYKNGNNIILLSYKTVVAEYNTETQKLVIHGWYSKTTKEHINLFLNKFGFHSMSKHEMQDFAKKSIS